MTEQVIYQDGDFGVTQERIWEYINAEIIRRAGMLEQVPCPFCPEVPPWEICDECGGSGLIWEERMKECSMDTVIRRGS